MRAARKEMRDLVAGAVIDIIFELFHVAADHPGIMSWLWRSTC